MLLGLIGVAGRVNMGHKCLCTHTRCKEDDTSLVTNMRDLSGELEPHSYDNIFKCKGGILQ